MLNLAVDPDHRAGGWAGFSLKRAAVVTSGGREAFLEVSESNAGALAMYLASGFRVVGARQRYYRQPMEDALVLHVPLPTSA